VPRLPPRRQRLLWALPPEAAAATASAACGSGAGAAVSRQGGNFVIKYY